MACYSELPYSAVCHVGRWSSEHTMRLYVQDSLSLINDLRFRMTADKARLVAVWRQGSCVEPNPKGQGRGRGRKH